MFQGNHPERTMKILNKDALTSETNQKQKV